MQFIDIATEQTTAATDAVLFLVAALFAWLLSQASRVSDKEKGRIWTAAFALLAIASALGTIAHGFKMGARTNEILWMPLNLALGLTVALFTIGAVYDLRGFSIPRALTPIMLAVGFVFFGVTVVVPDSFLVFVIYEAVAMLFALAVYLFLSVRGKLSGAPMMAVGVLISIAAAAVQALGAVRFTWIWEFDHNGAFHLIQIVGLVFLLIGLRKDFASRRRQPLPTSPGQEAIRGPSAHGNTMKTICLSLVLALFPLFGAPPRCSGQSIQQMANAELGKGRPGSVLGLIQGGDISFLEAFGTVGHEAEDSLRADHLFAFPAFTELLVSATVQSLVAGDILDPAVPLSTHFPLMSPRLGAITLGQLLTHSGGLDDARVLERFTWSEVMDQLNDAVLFTDPGMIHSRSRYSFPLVVRVIEKVTGRSFSEVADQIILSPLELTRSTFDLQKAEELGLVQGLEPNPDKSGEYRVVTPVERVDGLPVLFTTAEDILLFLGSWMAGGLKGASPWTDEWAALSPPLPGDPGPRGGWTVSSLQGHPQAFRDGWALGVDGHVTVLPEANTAVVNLAIGRISGQTRRLALDRVMAGLGPTEGAPEGELASEQEPTQLPQHAGGWVGRFLNGDRKVQLSQGSEGLLYHTSVELLDVKPGTGGAMLGLQRPSGQLALEFQLVKDKAGRRYAIVGGKAFIHEKDKRVYPHGF